MRSARVVSRRLRTSIVTKSNGSDLRRPSTGIGARGADRLRVVSQSLPDAYLREAKPLGGRLPEVRASRTRRESVVALAGVPLFADLPKRALQRLAKEADELSFQPGERLVEEGLLGETLFVVMQGQGKVTRRGRRVGAVVPGDFFGELSTIDGGPRTATVAAETPMKVLRVFRASLRKLIQDDPQLAVKIVDGIVRRIRQVERSA
jgi:CRP/FNR family transcriptional regulator, cyclic AMP receptor protein